MHLYREKGVSFPQSTQNIFHTQGGFSVLTLLAFGDEKYYICTEIWEEPRLLPFFVTFPLKSGVLEAHPVKICLPLVFLCLPQILIRGRLRKTTRREGKIRRREVFPKVKNVNVESAKKRSKLLDFWSAERRSDEARHLLLPFPVLRFLRSYRSLRSLQTLRTIRSIRVLNSIRTIRVLNSIREIRVQNRM